MSTRLLICDTCKRAGDEISLNKTSGERLADLVEGLETDVSIERHSCLMGCERACNIALSAPGKLTYVLGNFEPNAQDATAIAEYAALYSASENGRVPYREWPEGVKGHFIARIPPQDG